MFESERVTSEDEMLTITWVKKDKNIGWLLVGLSEEEQKGIIAKLKEEK